MSQSKQLEVPFDRVMSEPVSFKLGEHPYAPNIQVEQ